MLLTTRVQADSLKKMSQGCVSTRFTAHSESDMGLSRPATRVTTSSRCRPQKIGTLQALSALLGHLATKKNKGNSQGGSLEGVASPFKVHHLVGCLRGDNWTRLQQSQIRF